MRSGSHPTFVPPFDELLADFLEEPASVLGALSDIVNKGRMQADYLETDALEALGEYDLVLYLIQRSPGRPVRTWVYPSPTGLRVFGFLERAAEREVERERRERAKVGGRRSGRHKA